MIQIQPCSSKAAFDLAIEITNAYVQWLDLDLSFQNIDVELKNFATMYGESDGVFLLGFVDHILAGGVGLRKLDRDICEMKRLYVYDGFKGMGLGEKLCVALVEKAKQMNYQFMRLDTLDSMKSACHLYANLGFKRIDAYCFNPCPDVIYMELAL